jgi:hypothetical protein
MAINIQFRRGTASEWTAANPTLAVAEFGVETDTDKFKLGDGATAWTSLAYGGIKGDDGTSGVVTATSPLTYNAGTSTVGIDLSAYDTSSEVDTKLTDYDTSAEVDTKLADYDTSAEVDTKLTDYDTSAEVDTKVADSKLASFITDVTTARTLATATDSGKTIQFTSGSATVVTVNASTDLAVGARVDIIADGAGELTVAASGATIKAAEVSTTSGSFTIGAQYSAATLLCVATDEYRLIGNITAV